MAARIVNTTRPTIVRNAIRPYGRAYEFRKKLRGRCTSLRHMTVIRTLAQALAITAAAAAIAVATDLLRADGIPLVAEVPYDIFAPCRDSEAKPAAARAEEVGKSTAAVLYVDARPADLFAAEHVEGALSVPYSPLFGASSEDVARVVRAAKERAARSIAVYGVYLDPADPTRPVDLAKPLAEQLMEAELEGVGHVEGGLEALKKAGAPTVQAEGSTR